ncbi:DUF262 domain-containing protein [Clavibacter michiganensis]|nr:DUF262 domain-containing protein [Clavibacter michiganensis]
MNETRSQDITLEALLDGIHLGQVVLPDFQRDFDWSDQEVRSLIATVLMGWPIGSLLLIEGAANKEFYAPRSFEAAPAIAKNIVYIVLDGQQRLTSLYHALKGLGPLRYVIRLDRSANYSDVSALDDLIESMTVEAWDGLSHPSLQWAEGVIPLTALFSANAFYDWRDSAGVVPEDAKWLAALYRERFSTFSKFRVPAVVVDSAIAPAAISRVFQRINQGGQRLGAFDLMVAKTYSESFNLRSAWEKAQSEWPALLRHESDDGLPVLSVLALLTLRDVRQSAVLELSEEVVRPQFAVAAEHYAEAITFVEQELGVLTFEWLPYKQMLTVLAALAYKRDLSSMRELLAKWFWKTGLGHRYDSASNSQAVFDYRFLVKGQDPAPGELTMVREEMHESTKGRRGAVHRAYLCALGADATSRGGVLQGGVNASSLFKRQPSGQAPLHLRTLTFVLRDDNGRRLDRFGLSDAQPADYQSEADLQIAALSAFLLRDSGVKVRVISEEEVS